MLVQSKHLTKLLEDGKVLIELIDKLLTDILQDTSQLERGTSAFHCKDVPAISVGDYLRRIAKFANCSPVVYVISLIYMDRLQESLQSFVLNGHCVHRLLISTVMVAAKFADDHYYKNEYYAKIGGITKMDINALESELVRSLNYHLFIGQAELVVYLDRLEAYRDARHHKTH